MRHGLELEDDGAGSVHFNKMFETNIICSNERSGAGHGINNLIFNRTDIDVHLVIHS